MSVQAGLWNFDGQPPDEGWITTMSRELAQHGPDGEAVHRAPGLAMLYRPFHTTAESRLERQPYRSPRHVVTTWDGRLDNRTELVAELEGDLRDDRTDAAVAAAAYDRWGEEAFRRLVGDFAFVVWDEAKQCLYLAKDFAGARHLYYVLTPSSVRWSSRLDTLLLHGGGPWTLDEEWLGTYLMYRPSAYHTPYAEIRMIGPATFSKIERGREAIRRYWTWEPRRRIRYRTDAEYEEHFRALFRQSVQRRLRADAPVLAELSGGVDSSCIVSMADRIASDGEAETPRIDTTTRYRAGDPNGDLEFVHAIEQPRGRVGAHIEVADSPPGAGYYDEVPFIALPGASDAAWRVQRAVAAIMSKNGSRVVLSGIAGDEVCGGIPYPAGQLGDALVQGRCRELASLLVAWSRTKRIPVWRLAMLSGRHVLPRIRRRPDEVEAWISRGFASHLQLDRKYTSTVPVISWLTLPSQRVFANAFESERQVLTLHTLPPIGAIEKRYPFLDRDLVEFLFSIPSTQLLRPGDRRSLLRRSMRSLVPQAVLFRSAKSGGSCQLVATVQESGPSAVRVLDRHRELVGRYFDRASLVRALQAGAHGRHPSPLRLLRALDALLWIDALASRGLIRPATPFGSRAKPIRTSSAGILTRKEVTQK